MNVNELEQFLSDMVAFLEALNKWLPGRVDANLLELLKGCQHPWLLDHLVKTLPDKKAKG